MLQRISKFFNDLRISRKLGIGFGLLMSLTALVGIIAFIATNTQTSAFDRSAASSTKLDAADHIEINFLEARRQEKNFLMRHTSEGFDTAYSNYVVLNHQAVQAVLDRVQELRGKSPTAQELQTLQQIEESARDYQTEFDEVVGLIQQRGFKDTGLEGQFRASAHALEDEVADPALVTTLLRMRRAEKDYLLRGEQVDIDDVQNYNAQLQSEIRALTIPQADKNAMLAEANSYLTNFNALVDADRNVADKINGFTEHARAISPLVETYLSDKYAAFSEAHDQADAAARTSRIVNAVVLALTLILGLGLTWIISRVLNRQVTEIDRVFSDVRVGEFGVRARIFGRDELGRAADSVNAMLEQMTGLLREQQTLEQERIRTLAVLGWAWEVDAEGRYTYCSENVINMLGYTADEMLGKPLFDVMLPEEAARIEPLFNEMASKRQPITDLENWNRHKDGRAVCFQTVGVPVINSIGNLTGYRGATKDITESKQAEQERLRLNRQNELILNTVGEGVYGLDIQGNVIFANAAALQMDGYTDQELIGMHHHTLMHHSRADGSTYPEHECPVHATLVDGKPRHAENETFWNKNGKSFPVELTSSPIVEQGEIVGVVISYRDVTEQRRIVRDVEDAAAQVTDASSSMHAIVQLMVDQATNSVKMAEQATTRAQKGDQIVNETIAAMSRIRDNTQETAQRIKRLGEVSQEIGEAVRLIEEVADRTTVLALNASIQAAVAGEAGRGFAVVAEEVQRLAERASGATRKIEDLIKNIQAETNQAVIGVEEATREVVGGSHLAQEAGESMSELNRFVAQLADLIQQVAETTATQTTTSLVSLTQLSKGLQESVAAFGTVERAGGDGRDESRHLTSRRN